jgi:hypothetical protein
VPIKKEIPESYSLILTGEDPGKSEETSPYQTYGYLDLGLSSLQNYEKYISVVYKLPSLRYFVIAAQKNYKPLQMLTI